MQAHGHNLEVVDEAFAPATAPPPGKPLVDQMLALLSVVVKALAVRLMLLAACAASFAITWRVIDDTTLVATSALLIWNVFIVLPMIWLTTRRN